MDDEHKDAPKTITVSTRYFATLVSIAIGCAGLLAIEAGPASGNAFGWSLVGGAMILCAACIMAADLVKSWPKSK